MPSIFNAGGPEQTHNGSFRAEDLTVDFGGQSGVGALVQQAQFTVQRTVNMIYELGSSNVYYVGNRRQGTANLSRVVGSSTAFRELITKFGDMCEPDTLTLTAAGGCGGQSGTVNYDLLHATLTSIGGSVTANDIVINEQLAFICADIDVTA
jgi:hypothetical protein